MENIIYMKSTTTATTVSLNDPNPIVYSIVFIGLLSFKLISFVLLTFTGLCVMLIPKTTNKKGQ